MKKSRFTDSQIMAALKRVEVGLPVPEICRELERKRIRSMADFQIIN